MEAFVQFLWLLVHGGGRCLLGALDHGGEYVGDPRVLGLLQPPLELVPHHSDELMLAERPVTVLVEYGEENLDHVVGQTHTSTHLSPIQRIIKGVYKNYISIIYTILDPVPHQNFQHRL